MLDLPPNAVLADKCPVEVPLQVDPIFHPFMPYVCSAIRHMLGSVGHVQIYGPVSELCFSSSR